MMRHSCIYNCSPNDPVGLGCLKGCFSERFAESLTWVDKKGDRPVEGRGLTRVGVTLIERSSLQPGAVITWISGFTIWPAGVL